MPSSDNNSPRSRIRSTTFRLLKWGSSCPTRTCRSARVRPHQGARSTASHAVRSAGCSRARVKATRSRISRRSAKDSISTARKGIGSPSQLPRKAFTISRRCDRLRTSTAIFHGSVRSPGSTLERHLPAMWRASCASRRICAVRIAVRSSVTAA